MSTMKKYVQFLKGLVAEAEARDFEVDWQGQTE